MVYDVEGSFGPRQINEKKPVKRLLEVGLPPMKNEEYANKIDTFPGSCGSRPLKYDRLLCSLDHSVAERATASIVKPRHFSNPTKRFPESGRTSEANGSPPPWILS